MEICILETQGGGGDPKQRACNKGELKKSDIAEHGALMEKPPPNLVGRDLGD